MPKFLVERDIPAAGAWAPAQRQPAAAKSREVLSQLGPRIEWLESHVNDDKVYCVYISPSADLIREHAVRGGFPENRIAEIRAAMDPTTAEG